MVRTLKLTLHNTSAVTHTVTHVRFGPLSKAKQTFEQLHKECPYHVDLIPPPNGFGVQVEEAIYEFLDARIGAMDMYGEVKDGVPFVRYCFLKENDAELFRERFATAGQIINFPKAANG